MDSPSNLSLRVIEHLRKEGKAHGPIAALKVYAGSSNEKVARAAREALAALDKEDSDD
jgi:hypothetical protein